MPVAWTEDNPRDAPLIEANLRDLLRQIIREAPLRKLPAVSTAQEWHRRAYKNVRLPVSYYAGEVRDSDLRFPELFGYEVMVGPQPGVDSSQVPEELSIFEASMQQAVNLLDPIIPIGTSTANANQLRSVLTLCAYSHGEWVRIHPFANGNGRTARLWANWCAVRYGLPAFIRLKPRPMGSSYALAAADSMRGDHRAMIRVFAEMLDNRLIPS